MPHGVDTRPTEGFLLTRHLPHFRSTKFTVLAVGGALCVATASAAAATWPSASGASPPAMQQAAGLAATSSQANAGRSAGATVASATAIGARVVATYEAQARAAAVRAQALAARAHAAHVTHERHLTALAQAAAAARAAAAQQAAAQQAAQQQAASQQSAQQQPPPQTSAPSGSPQQIAEAMLAQFGWSGQFSCLDPLWERESGWNPSAENPSSGAYGIPQALPGSKMASAGSDWATNPATQIRWGLEYIQSTYGSPCAAWSHEEATGWY